MKLPNINKNTLLIIAIIIVIVAGYFTFKSGSKDKEAVTVEAAPVVGQELVVELNRLKALKNLTTNIFSDPVFNSLRDFTQPVPLQPLGRANPFAPIGSDL